MKMAAARVIALLGFMPWRNLIIPTFESEAEEAAWWERRRAEVETDLRSAMHGGEKVSLQDVLAKAGRKKELTIGSAAPAKD